MENRKKVAVVGGDTIPYFSTAMAITAAFGGEPRLLDNLLPRKLRRKPKQEKKCLHPWCDASTTHNGGYCSAECCKAHRILLKKVEQ